MFVYCKCYISIELTFLKELMLIKQVDQKECDICHYWYFCMDYCCIKSLISKNEAINLRQNADLTENMEHYKAQKIYYHIKKWVKKF